jgi:hypothetical protein
VAGAGGDKADQGDAPDIATLTENGRKARFGVMYMRTICAQAGVGFNETSPDEDVLATDGDVIFREANVRVQIKCTSGLTLEGPSASWEVRPEWLRAWADSKLPLYFVIVIVPSDVSDWLHHGPEGTVQRAAAYWCRINTDEVARRIHVPKANRLTEATLTKWHADMMEVFKP